MNAIATIRLLALTGAALLAAGALAQDAPIEPENGRTGQNKDVIISSEGLREGELAGCAGDSCTIDTVSIPRSRIMWIGLAADLSSMPAPEDPMRDEVHYQDGSVHPGRLVGINANEVVTWRGRHPRASVEWVFLTPHVKTAENAPGQVGAPSNGAAAANETGRSRPDEPSPPGAAPPPRPATPAQLLGMWEGRWKSQVRRYQVAEDIVGLARGDRQLEHDGTLEARFNFCADPEGTIHGAGTLKVRKNSSARLFKPFEKRSGGLHSDEITCNQTFKPTALDDVPLTIIGELRGADVWLFLNSGVVDFENTNSCVERDLLSGGVQSYVGGGPHKFPAVGLLFAAGGTTGAGLLNGVALPVRDGEMRPVQSRDVYSGGNWTPGFESLTLERTEVQIREDPLAGLPTVFDELFEEDLSELLPAATAQLETILPFFKCDVAAIATVFIQKGGDRLFLATLGQARTDALKAWFTGHGVDPGRVGWRGHIGEGDRVEFLFK